MKKLLTVFFGMTALVLTGCLDTQEDVTINADGSGVFKQTIDMSGMMDMMQMAAMMDTSANSSEMKKYMERDIDSSFSMRYFIDTTTSLTTEEKALFKDATVHMLIKQDDKVLKFSMTYPFKKLEDLQKIMELQRRGKGFNPLGNSKGSGELGLDEQEGSLPLSTDVTEMVFKKGLIERKVDDKTVEELKNKEELKNAEQAAAVFSQITFSTAIHLPKPVNKATGEKLVVSDDKKTILIKYNLAEMMSNPKLLEFKVEY